MNKHQLANMLEDFASLRGLIASGSDKESLAFISKLENKARTTAGLAVLEEIFSEDWASYVAAATEPSLGEFFAQHLANARRREIFKEKYFLGTDETRYQYFLGPDETRYQELSWIALTRVINGK